MWAFNPATLAALCTPTIAEFPTFVKATLCCCICGWLVTRTTCWTDDDVADDGATERTVVGMATDTAFGTASAPRCVVPDALALTRRIMLDTPDACVTMAMWLCVPAVTFRSDPATLPCGNNTCVIALLPVDVTALEIFTGTTRFDAPLFVAEPKVTIFGAPVICPDKADAGRTIFPPGFVDSGSVTTFDPDDTGMRITRIFPGNPWIPAVERAMLTIWPDTGTLNLRPANDCGTTARTMIRFTPAFVEFAVTVRTLVVAVGTRTTEHGIFPGWTLVITVWGACTTECTGTYDTAPIVGAWTFDGIFTMSFCRWSAAASFRSSPNPDSLSAALSKSWNLFWPWKIILL